MLVQGSIFCEPGFGDRESGGGRAVASVPGGRGPPSTASPRAYSARDFIDLNMPTTTPAAFKQYLNSVRQALAAGNSTEHTFRSMVEALVASFGDDVRATNEPQRIACGAPDFIVTRRNIPLG